ncbi:TetR/AcrR family transcriptional regulator [Nocardioides litoris]|uniref:TetR/AcrR family transcriptional regulator n=1 Tax=Nocardioides litoris TaxID=1926648 RepID=UPI00111DF386|nr:TetR/AcrR family transcriptional regulator [Nocardioides litoris]
MDEGPRRLLPLADDRPVERADAARNREALLRAAAELVDHCSVEGVTMDAVAQRAGVGKGTVFRRFESREGLMAALLDHVEADWQASVLSGPPPLGPGAPARERLLAFGHSRIDASLRGAALIRAAGHAGSRSTAAASFTAMHVRHLLGEIGVRGDLTYLTAALLAPLEIPILEQQLRHDGLSLERICDGWDDLVERVVGPRP